MGVQRKLQYTHLKNKVIGMFRGSYTIDISKTDLSQDVQRKLQYTYLKNKFIGCSEEVTYRYLKNRLVIGCSEEVTVYISVKINFMAMFRGMLQYTYLVVRVFRGSYSIDILSINLQGVQRKLQYTYLKNKLVEFSEKVTVYIC